jgi:hypothetical protein
MDGRKGNPMVGCGVSCCIEGHKRERKRKKRKEKKEGLGGGEKRGKK